MRLISPHAYWYVAALCFLALFFGLLDSLHSQWLRDMDNVIGQAIYHLQGNVLFDLYYRWALLLNGWGQAKHIIPAAAVITIWLFIVKMRREAGFFVLSLCLASELAELIKVLVMRPRPEVEHLAHASGYAFPSAHAAVSAAFIGALIYIMGKKIFTYGWRKIIGWSVGIMVICLTGFTRVLLGLHHPSDVIAGFALAGFCIAICGAGFFGKAHDRKR